MKILFLLIFLMILLLFLAPISFEINTSQKKYAMIFLFIRIQYDCFQNQKGTRFFFFHYSWFKKFSHWKKEKSKIQNEERGKRLKLSKKNQFIKLFLNKRALCMEVLLQSKPLLRNLLKKSYYRLEIHINTSDFITNSLLYAILFHWQTNNLTVNINYFDNNYAIFYLKLQIAVLILILGKFIFSPPILKLAYFFIKDKLSYQN